MLETVSDFVCLAVPMIKSLSTANVNAEWDSILITVPAQLVPNTAHPSTGYAIVKPTTIQYLQEQLVLSPTTTAMVKAAIGIKIRNHADVIHHMSGFMVVANSHRAVDKTKSGMVKIAIVCMDIGK